MLHAKKGFYNDHLKLHVVSEKNRTVNNLAKPVPSINLNIFSSFFFEYGTLRKQEMLVLRATCRKRCHRHVRD